VIAPLFVSHGAPDLLTTPGAAHDFLAKLGERRPRPRRALVASAHWTTGAPAVDVSATPRTIHDFAGFGEELGRATYAARGAPELAREVAARLREAGLDVDERERGLDHGAWVPLALLFPQADVATCQLSLQPDVDDAPRRHLELGRALAPALGEETLLLGSGGATHDLASLGREDDGSAKAFDDWLVARVEEGDVEALLEYRERAPFAARHHPTEEHLLPLFVALGAAGPGARGRALHRSTTWGALSMTAFEFPSARA
jgi:4,5-DOPA dioxygenase extradiol